MAKLEEWEERTMGWVGSSQVVFRVINMDVAMSKDDDFINSGVVIQDSLGMVTVGMVSVEVTKALAMRMDFFLCRRMALR